MPPLVPPRFLVRLARRRHAARDSTPEIGWQPEFDRAREVLVKRLLEPGTKPMAGN